MWFFFLTSLSLAFCRSCLVAPWSYGAEVFRSLQEGQRHFPGKFGSGSQHVLGPRVGMKCAQMMHPPPPHKAGWQKSEISGHWAGFFRFQCSPKAPCVTCPITLSIIPLPGPMEHFSPPPLIYLLFCNLLFPSLLCP